MSGSMPQVSNHNCPWCLRLREPKRRILMSTDYTFTTEALCDECVSKVSMVIQIVQDGR